MSEALRDLLSAYLQASASDESGSQTFDSNYLNRLTSLSTSALGSTENDSLRQAAHSTLVSLRALASRSARSTVTSATHLATLSDTVPDVLTAVSELRDVLPSLDSHAVQFSNTYSKSRDENQMLERRKNAMLLSRQAEKISEILELPSLLATTIASASVGASGGVNYSQAIDLFAHIRRLQILYPDTDLIQSVVREAEIAMKLMTSNLILGLRSSNIRLAAAIRTIGFLRRVAPELSVTSSIASQDSRTPSTETADEGVLGALFLTARLANLLTTLEALSPLRELADQETTKRLSDGTKPADTLTRKTSGGGYVSQGPQTERYLKRYIEIFREQAFNTISMYRNIFPSSDDADLPDPLGLPSALATFPMHLVDMLMETLNTYLPNVKDSQARESLLMQVLYAANSLGRLGADFTMMLAFLEDEEDSNRPARENATKSGSDENGSLETHEPPEWVRAIEKHRVQAARLEALASSQALPASRKASDGLAAR